MDHHRAVLYESLPKWFDEMKVFLTYFHQHTYTEDMNKSEYLFELKTSKVIQCLTEVKYLIY